jgi:centromere-localized protein 2
MVEALGAAVAAVESEVEALEGGNEVLLEDIGGMVGGLSDLRYGRFANSQMGGDVLRGLQGLERKCELSRAGS